MPRTVAHSLLEWQRQMGADEAVPETPHPMWQPVRSVDEQMQHAMQALQSASAATMSTRPSAPPPPAANIALTGGLAESLADAQAAAAAATTIEELKAAVAAFEGCSLKRTAKNTVFGDGNSQAKLLLIGEAPGEDEDRMGIPFCGRSGQLLERMFQAIGLERATDFYISNSIYWRPPGNRAPSSEELAICRPFVNRLIALMQPKMIVLIGGGAAKAVLEQEASVAQLRRSASLSYSAPELSAPVPARVLYHPAYLLRTPSQKAAAWKDLLALKQQISKNQ